MSADTGTSTAATIRAMTAAARSAPRPAPPKPAPSGTPRDQATPALVVAIAFAPASAIATAEATSHAFGSSSGSPALCRFAKAMARCACSMADSEPDDQLVVELGELDDHARELAGDQVAVGRRARVRVVGGLIGE